MQFIIIAICSATIALWPTRISILGRILALVVAAWCTIYGFAVVGQHTPAGIGALARFIDLEPSLYSATTATAVLSLLLVIVSSFSFRTASHALNVGSLDIRLPNWIAYPTLALCSATALSVAFALGLRTLYEYSDYGSIKDLYAVYQGNIIGRIGAALFRLITIPLIVFSILRLNRRDYIYFLLCLPALSFSLVVGLAEASRITTVYFAVFSLSFFLSGKRVAGVVCVLLAFASIVYALEARGHRELGLRYIGEYAALGITNAGAVEGAITNVATGLLVTSATVNVGVPGNYTSEFKALSFSPLVDAIDGFQAAKSYSEQRMLWYLPFNAFGEVWLFGPLYTILFWSILFSASLCVNSSMRFGIIPYAIMVCVFILGIAIASQYPTRNALRVIYFCIILRIAMGIAAQIFTRVPRVAKQVTKTRESSASARPRL
jgi:hypothetical protein